ncbi:hypothetical protein HI914_04592 [Erysiphe necator]|nr:hypothetical protein HI914_04592 [Erysiphe necator]
MHPLILAVSRNLTHQLILHSRCLLRLSSSLSSNLLVNKDNSYSIEVPCRDSGSIRVDFYNQHLLEDPSKPLVVYLPSTGVHLSRYHQPIPTYFLSASTALARINYRWNIPSTDQKVQSSFFHPSNSLSNYHPFPFPIHDTLQAWTFITESFLPNFNLAKSVTLPESKVKSTELRPSSQEIPRSISRRPIIIYGDFLGASIAMSLALTESFEDYLELTHEIRLIVNQGVYDWVDIGTTLLSKAASELIQVHRKYKDVGSSWDKLNLLQLRKHLFSGPNRCLDVFASPSLFFRQAGMSAPADWDKLTQPSSYFSPCFIRDMLNPCRKKNRVNTNLEEEKPSNVSELIYSSDIIQDVQSLRLSHTSLTIRPYLEFPSIHSQLKIPKTLLLFRDTPPPEKSEDYELIDKEIPESKLLKVTPMQQAEYMADLMRHSVEKYSRNERDPANTIQVRRLKGDLIEEGDIVAKWINEIS